MTVASSEQGAQARPLKLSLAELIDNAAEEIELQDENFARLLAMTLHIGQMMTRQSISRMRVFWRSPRSRILTTASMLIARMKLKSMVSSAKRCDGEMKHAIRINPHGMYRR